MMYSVFGKITSIGFCLHVFHFQMDMMDLNKIPKLFSTIFHQLVIVQSLCTVKPARFVSDFFFCVSQKMIFKMIQFANKSFRTCLRIESF